MLTHQGMWQAIDRLAEKRGISPAHLARQAGLDPAAFSNSRRTGPNGKEHWPSMASLSRLLRATGVDFVEFAAIARNIPGAQEITIPLLSLSQSLDGQFFHEDGYPNMAQWGRYPFPNLQGDDLFALKVDNDQHDPVYPQGTVLICAPGANPRPGNRVVVKMDMREFMLRTLVRHTVHRAEMIPVTGGESELIMTRDIQWMSRIAWAAQ